MTVLVVGGANLDLLARSGAPIRLGTSNPGAASVTAGGVGRNVAENLARLGTPTRLVLAVGADPAGDLLLTRSRAAGVEPLVVPWAGATGSYTALLDADGSLLAGIADMAATASIGPDDVPALLVASCSWLVLDGNLATATLAHGLRLAATAGVPVVIDPVSAPKAAALSPVLDGVPVHTLTPTRDELVALTGCDDPAVAAAQLHGRGVQVVWLRDGDQGSTLFRAGAAPEPISLGRVDPVDVTGAGDAMLAAYLHEVGGGADLLRAAYAGAAAALLTVLSPHTVREDLSEHLIREVLADRGPRGNL